MKCNRQLFKTFLVLMATLFLISCGGGSDTSRLAGGLTLSSTASTLNVGGSGYSEIKAKVTKDDGTPLYNSDVVFETNLGVFSGGSRTKTVRTNSLGVAKIELYPSDISGTAVIYASSGGYNASISVVINPRSGGGGSDASLGAIVISPVVSKIYANGTDVVAINVTTYDTSPLQGTNVLLPNTSVMITTTAGFLSLSENDFTSASRSMTVVTNARGTNRVYLQASTSVAVARITATSAGVPADEQYVTFVADTPSASNSSLTASPSSLPADGGGTATVTLSLRDSNNNLVADGTAVTLQTTAGTIMSDNPTATILGRATFTLRAPATAATAALSISQYPGITNTVTFGSETNANPANIEFNIANTQLFIFGVGKQDTTTLTISVKTAAGNLISDANPTINNLKVSLKTRPNAGEKLIGKDAAGSVIETSSTIPFISVRTINGVATLTLQSGTLPGVVEIEAEALLPDGTALPRPLIGIVPQVSIASGAPKSINLSYPVSGSLENLGNGVYRRVGSAFVTDQFGNAVPDGTVISLGVLDSVIVSNNADANYAVNATNDANASVAADSKTLTDNSNTPFSAAFITRNNTSRFVEKNDRVLLLNAQADSKSRFADTVNGDNILTNKAYKKADINLSYVVGSSLLGAQIEGVNMQTNAPVLGQATTKNGSATFYLRYPADNEHILTGCFQGNPQLDTRSTAFPAGSAQVWVVAESTETGATTVDNRACFSALLNYSLINDFGVDAISGTANIGFTVRDSSLIPLPFVGLSSSVVIETNTGGLTVTVGNCATRTDRRTLENGTCSLPITVTGGVSGDSATVTIGAPGNATPVTISVTIP